MSLKIPESLVRAVREQRAVLFLGSGASKGALHDQGLTIPSGLELRDSLCDKFLGSSLKDRALSEVAQLAINETDLVTLQSHIRDIFLGFKPADFHRLVPRFQWHSIVSTNYDLIVERSYEAESGSLQELVLFVKDGVRVESALKATVNGVQYLKLHGCINHWTDNEIPLILAAEQYARFSSNRSRLFQRVRDWGYELPIIFCGYAVGDPHIQSILFDLFDQGINRPAYYVVLKGISEYESRYWSSRRIVPIDASYADFLVALDQAIPKAQRALSTSLGGGEASIRKHYRIANPTESEQLMAFLSSDVEHVRAGMPLEAQDAQAFYRGYDTGFGACEANLDIERRITDTVLVDAVLAEERDRSGPVDLFVLKGPAGNGKTTVLKRVAWEAAHEFDKLVLYLRESGAIRHEAIQEIHNLVRERFFLFVDRAALRSFDIRKLLEFCRSRTIAITVVTAERDNEWNVRCDELDEFVSKDYPIRFLGEREIESLLKKLEANDALGALAPMTYEERVDFFVNRAQRQLLVALHEATLGRPFVEIVLDEYKRLAPQEAQDLYLDVCTLNRFGVGVRAGLISRISGLRFEDFRTRFFKPLEQVVRISHDKYVNDHVYAARHQHVGEMVFENVLTDAELRYDRIVRLVRGMNLDYSTDLVAFRQLVRGRVVVDTFRSQELGRRFYEVVTTLVGEDAYVLQQLGLFEMRHEGGDLKRAEAALSKAADLAPHDKSIQHSSANLARMQAQRAQNPLLRETYRKRARERLDGLTGLGARRPHGYYTSAQLGLDEFRDLLSAPTVEESEPLIERQVVELARRIELSLSNGLQRFPENPHLIALEADYLELIEEHGKAEEALKRAFESNPRLDWLARRLAQRLAQGGGFEEAKKTLRKCVTENPGSKSANLSLAKLYMDHGNERERALVLDHLRRGFSEGDKNYDAQFWYARELFLRGEDEESLRLFERLQHAAVPPDVRSRIRGVIKDEDGSPLKVRGTAVKKEESYMFVKTERFGRDIFVHSHHVSTSDWDRLKVGTALILEVGFTMRGPIAASVTGDEAV